MNQETDNKTFKYETHLHTRGPSRCAVSTGDEQAAFMKEQGYQGIVVTDHFFNGHSGIDPDLPWEERVEQYCAGYEAAKAEGDRIGLDVFFGIEWNFHQDEFLLYGVSKEWLLNHPDMLSWTHMELFEEMNRINGLMIQAHPFRDREYVRKIHVYPELVHGIEVTNAGHLAYNDRFAYEYAKHYRLHCTSGSDLHVSRVPARGLRGIISDTRWNSIYDYINMVKKNEGYTLITSDDSSGILPEDRIIMPASLYDANEQEVPGKLREIFGDRITS